MFASKPIILVLTFDGGLIKVPDTASGGDEGVTQLVTLTEEEDVAKLSLS